MGETAPLTPYLILDKVLKMEKYLSAADTFRMDQFGMTRKMEDLLSQENLECLRRFNEPDVNRTIIRHLISSARVFPLPLLKGLITRLESLAGNDPESRENIRQLKKYLASKHKKEKYTLTNDCCGYHCYLPGHLFCRQAIIRRFTANLFLFGCLPGL